MKYILCLMGLLVSVNASSENLSKSQEFRSLCGKTTSELTEPWAQAFVLISSIPAFQNVSNALCQANKIELTTHREGQTVQFDLDKLDRKAKQEIGISLRQDVAQQATPEILAGYLVDAGAALICPGFLEECTENYFPLSSSGEREYFRKSLRVIAWIQTRAWEKDWREPEHPESIIGEVRFWLSHRANYKKQVIQAAGLSLSEKMEILDFQIGQKENEELWAREQKKKIESTAQTASTLGKRLYLENKWARWAKNVEGAAKWGRQRLERELLQTQKTKGFLDSIINNLDTMSFE